MMTSGMILDDRLRQSLRRVLTWWLCSILCCALPVPASAAGDSDPVIRMIEPDPRGGIGYRLIYYVNVPLETYWRFKTDFEGSYLATNQFIKEHRLVRREDHAVITENSYTVGPDATYLWRTRVFNGRHRLDFSLLNPKECGQKFHYGYIQATSQGNTTRVTQVAYLDFFGVSFWAHYPWGGGMKEFLRSTARWEQATAMRLEWRYAAKNE